MRTVHLGTSALVLTLTLTGCGQQTPASTGGAFSATVQGINGTEIVSGGVYRLTNTNSGLALDVAEVSMSSGANVQVWARNDRANQSWKIEDAGNGFATLKAQHSNLCLKVQNSSTNVQQYTCENTNAQKWKLVSLGNGEYKLLSAADTWQALDVSGSGTANGSNVQVYADNGSGAQKWKLERLDTGTGGGGSSPNSVKTTYTADYTTNFPNPERGFTGGPWHIFPGPEGSLEDGRAKFATLRSQGMTLVPTRWSAADFRDTDTLSQDFLRRIDGDFAAARAAGIKLVGRLTYNWDNCEGKPADQDAPLSRALGHLDQLKDTLRKNVDVLAYLDVGVVGCWGEHHDSSNGLTEAGPMKAIIEKELAILPPSRMVAMRYPWHRNRLLSADGAFWTLPPVLTADSAFSGSAQSRIGNYNDCVFCGAHDGGTYEYLPVETFKNFLNKENLFVVQGGEPGDCCGQDSKPEDYDDCANTLRDLSRMRWSTLQSNQPFAKRLYDRWKSEGCYEEIARKLGYRYRLVESEIPTSVTRGGSLNLSIKVTNDGWASAYNPRAVEVILRNKASGQKLVLTDAVGSIREEDPRFWLPGETHGITLAGYSVPSDLPVGEYEVLLNLPDPLPSVHDRPEYSIRLANQNTWEASTGYNKLLRSIYVQ